MAAVRADHTLVPALLTEPGFCGTLAAARHLGQRGVAVRTMGRALGAPTAHSRYVGRHWRSPRMDDIGRRVGLLMQIGRLHPGTVLYPTSDDFAWLQAAHATSLRRYFRMYSPEIEAIENILDKRRLSDACRQVGIEFPESCFAESRADVVAAAQSARFPVLLKQRTQIFSDTKSKGALVHRAADLVAAYDRFVAENRHAPEVAARMPFASWPIIQTFLPDAHRGSYLVSGFVNRDHSQIAAQAARKVLQYPRTLGIALCMEPAPLDDDLTARILALCKLTGHFGVFQIEFLVEGERKLLIDFNPRYYHYMAFDIARGLPLPWFAHLGACGDEAGLARAMRESGGSLDSRPSAFCFRLELAELLWAQRLTGTMSREDFHRWRRWYRTHRGHIVDAVAAAGDRWPEITAGIAKWALNLRHPRAFIRRIAFDR